MLKKVIMFLFITINVLYSFEIGALDPRYWNGIILNDSGNIYGFRFAIEKNGKIADGYDTFFIVEKPGIISDDYSYAEISFNTNLEFGLKSKTPIKLKGTETKGILKLVYGRYGKGVIGYLTIPDNINIILKFYSPWDMGRNIIYKDGIFISPETNFKFLSIEKKLSPTFNRKNEIYSKIKTKRFYFYAGFEKFAKNKKWIKKQLKIAKQKYERNRVRFDGEFKGLISSITTNLYWMKCLQPDKNRVYIPAGRRWLFPGKNCKQDLWTMFEWDSFFNAIEVAVEDSKLAKKEVEAVIDTQYKWGNIPNWRSASAGATDRAQPPISAYAVLKIFYKTGDINLLRNSYKRLIKFHRYWIKDIGKHLKRDGNNNFLFEWGSDTELINDFLPSWEKGASGRTRAAWESGQDDLPNYDNVKFNEETNSIELDCIDLSSLIALDSYSLYKIAGILGYKNNESFYKEEFEKISKQINKVLWNEDKGFYFDRYWDGKFSNSKAASNFYPLLAGVVPDNRVKRVLKHFLNNKEFWGDFVIPTISRDNPSFKDQQYWRGTIWPPTNYLVYQGLKRYEFDKIASEFARKSAALFLSSWKKYGLCRENYNSVTGEGGGQRYQSWGPLFALILIEDFIDNSPFEGFRVGNLAAKKENSIYNYKIGENRFDIISANNSLTLYKNSKKVLFFKGKAVLRHLRIGDNKIESDISIYSNKFKINPIFKKYRVIIDRKEVNKDYEFKKGKYHINLIKSIK